MWLSRIICNSKSSESAEKGRVTLSSSENWEADGSRTVRNIETYLPYGYSAAAPVGEEVLLLPAADSTVAVGTKSSSEGIEAGEVRIQSKGGASIVLKNDGSVIINNSLIIDREGNSDICN